MIKLSRLYIPYIFLLILIGYKGNLVLTFIMIIIHETVHFLTARKLGYTSDYVELYPFGTKLEFNSLDNASLKQNLIIAASGSVVNICLALLGVFLWLIFKHKIFLNIFMINLSLGLFNLLPVIPLDGGLILKELLSTKVRYKDSSRIVIGISIGTGLLLLTLNFIIFIVYNININIYIIAVVIIYFSYLERERVKYIIMIDIIRKRQRLHRKKYIECKCTSVHFSVELAFVMGLMDKNKYNIFLILNDEMKLIGIIYEEEIIAILKEKGNMSVMELLDSKVNNWEMEAVVVK